MASFMAKQTPLFPQCELFVFCAWWYASGHEFPGNALYDQFVSFFARNVFTVARLVTIIALKVKFWCVFVATARSSLGDKATAQMLDTQSFVGKSGQLDRKTAGFGCDGDFCFSDIEKIYEIYFRIQKYTFSNEMFLEQWDAKQGELRNKGDGLRNEWSGSAPLGQLTKCWRKMGIW